MADAESVKSKHSKYLSLASQVLVFLTEKIVLFQNHQNPLAPPGSGCPSGLAAGRAFPPVETSEPFQKKPPLSSKKIGKAAKAC